jgi:hypothetical protein
MRPSATRWEITAPSWPAGDIPNRPFRRAAVPRPGWRPIQPARHDEAVSGGEAVPVRLRRDRALRRHRAAAAWTPASRGRRPARPDPARAALTSPVPDRGRSATSSRACATAATVRSPRTGPAWACRVFRQAALAGSAPANRVPPSLGSMNTRALVAGDLELCVPGEPLARPHRGRPLPSSSSVKLSSRCLPSAQYRSVRLRLQRSGSRTCTFEDGPLTWPHHRLLTRTLL